MLEICCSVDVAFHSFMVLLGCETITKRGKFLFCELQKLENTVKSKESLTSLVWTRAVLQLESFCVGIFCFGLLDCRDAKLQ